MGRGARQARLKVLEGLEERAKQFRGRQAIWPFRVPHRPIAFDASALQPRVVLRLEWPESAWELWSIALPSGILLYCDSDGHESRVLASVKRRNASEADGFFLERLAESRGEFFGIEMAGPPPERMRSSIGDRDFLADVFVELFEGTEAARDVGRASPDFHADVVRWLGRVLTAPAAARRQPRLAEAMTGN
jgi:hypothetical protein